jgi:hypothetical protein
MDNKLEKFFNSKGFKSYRVWGVTLLLIAVWCKTNWIAPPDPKTRPITYQIYRFFKDYPDDVDAERIAEAYLKEVFPKGTPPEVIDQISQSEGWDCPDAGSTDTDTNFRNCYIYKIQVPFNIYEDETIIDFVYDEDTDVSGTATSVPKKSTLTLRKFSVNSNYNFFPPLPMP